MKPTYQTEFSAAADITAAHDQTVNPGCTAIIKTGYVCTAETFTDCAALLLIARSSLPIKKGLMVANGIGLIDSDYREEIGVIVYNFTRQPVTVNSGERIAQLMPISHAGLGEVSDFTKSEAERCGGFGSTGQTT